MSTRSSIKDFEKEVLSVYKALLVEGLAISNLNPLQQFPKSNNRIQLHTASTIGDLESGIDKRVPYECLYADCSQNNAFNFKLIDGALVQLSYEFEGKRSLVRSVQRYLPSPDLTPFIQDLSLYVNEVPFAEIVSERTVTIPLRFDFDSRSDSIGENHPASHLTLGEYPNCRIPTSHPLSPAQFTEFVVNAFYSDGHNPARSSADLGGCVSSLTEYITKAEQQRIHISAAC